MAKRVQIVGGTAASLAAYAGLVREVTVDTDNSRLAIHTGSGAGTHVLVYGKTENDTLYQTKSTLLTNIAALSTADGIPAKTGASTVALRTLTGTALQIAVANGGGAGGNPTFSLPSAITAPGSLAVTTTLAVTGATTTSAGINAGGTVAIAAGGLIVSAGGATVTGTFTQSTGGILNQDLPLVGGIVRDESSPRTAKGSVSGAQSMDYTLGHAFSATATGTITWSITNPPATGNLGSIILYLTNGGAGAQTWMTTTKWPGGVAPVLQAAGTDILTFSTIDGGTTWYGAYSLAMA